MTKFYIVLDENNALLTRMTDEDGAVPAAAIEVEYSLWFQTMQETDGLWLLNADGAITKHPFPPPPPPAPEEILSANQTQQTELKNQASQTMTPLLLSLQLGDATAEETARAKAWQAYYRLLSAVDVTVAEPEWPIIPA
jgi:hypothetical protein